jgi:hypothetical protein
MFQSQRSLSNSGPFFSVKNSDTFGREDPQLALFDAVRWAETQGLQGRAPRLRSAGPRPDPPRPVRMWFGTSAQSAKVEVATVTVTPKFSRPCPSGRIFPEVGLC